MKLEKLAQDVGPGEVDLRGALKNTDPIAPSGKLRERVSPTPVAPAMSLAPSVATSDPGSTADQQLDEAVDVLRGLSLIEGGRDSVSSAPRT